MVQKSYTVKNISRVNWLGTCCYCGWTFKAGSACEVEDEMRFHVEEVHAHNSVKAEKSVKAKPEKPRVMVSDYRNGYLFTFTIHDSTCVIEIAFEDDEAVVAACFGSDAVSREQMDRYTRRAKLIAAMLEE